MASAIDTELRKIMNSIYGKDVRQAIHDAILQCYSDVSNPDLNTSAFYDAVQEAIQDGSLATLEIPDGSITQSKLASDVKLTIDDGEITLAKLASDIVFKALCDNVVATTAVEDVELMTSSEWIDNTYINGSGNPIDNTAYKSTDFIPCGGNVVIRYEYKKNSLKGGFCCYDSEKHYLGNVSKSEYSTKDEIDTLTTLVNTAFIRISVANGVATNPNNNYLAYLPMTVTTYDWKDTSTQRMNQLAVRENFDARLTALDGLLWNYTKWNGKYIVADGNSLVESSNWLKDTCEMLGAIPVNMGKSGSAITRPDQPSASATIAQKQEYIRNNIANNYPEKADLIILQESSYLDGDYSDQMDGVNPKATWTARMNYFIRCLKTKYPNVLIVLIPDPTWYTAGTGSAGNDSTLNTNIADFIYNSRNAESLRVMRGLAEYNRLAFFDLDHSTPFNPLQKTNYYSQYYWLHEQYPSTGQDGVHPYRPYNVSKGKALAHWIAGLIFDPDAPNDAVENWQNLVYTINSDGSCTYPNIGTAE